MHCTLSLIIHIAQQFEALACYMNNRRVTQLSIGVFTRSHAALKVVYLACLELRSLQQLEVMNLVVE